MHEVSPPEGASLEGGNVSLEERLKSTSEEPEASNESGTALTHPEIAPCQRA